MKKNRVKNWARDGKMTKKLNQPSDNFDLNMWQIFDISLFGRSKDRVLNIIGDKLDSGTKKYWVATVNPEFVMESLKDDDFKTILKKTDLNVMDGIGLVWAREVLNIKRFFGGIKVGVEVLQGKYKNEIASGADLVLDLSKMAAEKGFKMFFLGGFDDRAQKTAEFLKNEFGLKQERLDWCAGEPSVSNDEVVERINKFKPDILLVAYGMKKQEFWIDKNLDKLDIGMVMGVGRSFDYYSGELKRAPKWCQRMGLEWLYSLIKEPKRIKRQLVLPRFIWKVLTK